MTILIFILVLGLLVFVHELGHFLMARKTKMRVEEFGIGFPPRIWSFRKGETRYSVNLIPLGGFVKITGENGEDQQNPESFINKKIWQRALVLIAGVSMNVLLAYLILIIGFSMGLPHILDDQIPPNAKVTDKSVQIIEIAKDSPAEAAGLLTGDVVLTIDNFKIEKSDYLKNYVKENNNPSILLNIRRGEDFIEQEIILAKIPESDYPVMGVVVADTGVVSYPWYISIWVALKNTFVLLWNILSLFGIIVYNLITTGKLAVDLSGPVGIAVMTGQAIHLGFAYLLRFVAVLSLNLAIINILPFPALDGGKLVFLAIEKLKGSPVNQKIENLIHNFGFLLLLLLIVVVTYRDVLKFSGKIIGTFKQIF